MAAKSDDFEESLLNAVLNNDVSGSLANLGDGLQASVTPGSVTVHLILQSAGPPTDTWASAQVVAGAPIYPAYAAQSVARNSGSPKWTVTGGTATNVEDIVFPTSDIASGSDVVEYAAVMDSSSTSILWYGTLTSALSISNGITPQIDAGDLTINED